MSGQGVSADGKTKREAKYDAEGNFDEYRNSVQRSMEKPYPDNGGFYGVGALREMGLRKVAVYMLPNAAEARRF